MSKNFIQVGSFDFDAHKVKEKALQVVYVRTMGLKGDIEEKFYSGQSDTSLGRRTGQAARGWHVIKAGENGFAIVNNVLHSDHSKEKKITPKKGKYLAIPAGEGVTKAGRARYSSPSDLKGSFVIPSKKNKENLLVMQKANKGAKLMFVLTKEVTIPARTEGLLPFIKQRGESFANSISKELMRLR